MLLKWRLLLFVGQKIMSMKMEHLNLIDSMFSALPAPQGIQRIQSDRIERVVPSLL